MPNLLILSENDLFKQDLQEQIDRYAPHYTIDSPSAAVDMIVADEKEYDIKYLQKKYPQTPILVLLSKGSDKPEDSRLLKYEVKPFNLFSLLNDLDAMVNLAANSDAGRLRFNKYELRPLSKEIVDIKNDVAVKLTEKEVAIIQYLYKIRGRNVSKTELLQEVWGYSPDVSTHTIETHIYRLRQKVETGNDASPLIITDNGGYQLAR